MHGKRLSLGFGIIELVAVILIVGILAAIAIPCYSALQGSSRYASLKQMQGAINSAITFVHSIAIVKNQLQATGSITLDSGQTVTLVNGYPDATSSGIIASLQDGFNMPIDGPHLNGVGLRYIEVMLIDKNLHN